MISIIVAIDNNLAIGKGGELPWHLSDDLKRFKAITSNYTVVMGRNTWNSLPFKPHKNRRNIVISSKFESVDGAEVVKSIDEAVAITKSDEKVFIIGGAKIYNAFMDIADELIVTEIFHSFEECDTHFPLIEKSIWEAIDRSAIMEDEKSLLKYQYITYRRIL